MWEPFEERVGRAELAYAGAADQAAVARVRARCEPLVGELLAVHRERAEDGGWRVASALLARLLVAHMGAVQAAGGRRCGDERARDKASDPCRAAAPAAA